MHWPPNPRIFCSHTRVEARDAFPWIFRVSGLEVEDALACTSPRLLCSHTWVEARDALPWIIRVSDLEVEDALAFQVRGFFVRTPR